MRPIRHPELTWPTLTKSVKKTGFNKKTGVYGIYTDRVNKKIIVFNHFEMSIQRLFMYEGIHK